MSGTKKLILRVASAVARAIRDKGGNTLAMGAASLIPLAGMVGGGLDMSRIYLTKTRMQHACDAGALAGRRMMAGGTWSQNSFAPRASAERFFDANFSSGSYGSSPVTRNFTETNGTVTGTASTTLPMTLMRVLGRTSEPISVDCDAAMRLPNTDVMFVLDTTGSMNCPAGTPSCGNTPLPNSKIEGLRVAVKCFYEIVARLDTDATCATGTPSGGTGSEVQIRFGFVPYASNVNVGYSLPTSYFANSWNYQSRVQNGGSWGDWEYYGYGSPGNNGAGAGNCKPDRTDTSIKQYKAEKARFGGVDYCAYYERSWTPRWNYQRVATNVAGLKNGTSWNTSFQLPINNDGSNRAIEWSGCIEERPTVRTTNFNPIPANAFDLNIDLVPTSGNANSLWGFSLPDLIYLRDVTSSYNDLNSDPSTSTSNYYNNLSDNCPTAARRLQSWPTASAFDDYVDSLVARGNTYHDIGLLWGARFASPTGIFAADNAFTPRGGEIQRHMIFMTDGDSTSNPCDYNAYGVPWFDQRQTTDVGSARNCGSNRQALIDQIDLRMAALCTAIRNKNITLWVVSYGGGLDAATETRLENCASAGRYFQATDGPTLQTTFKRIADEISMLRLTQ